MWDEIELKDSEIGFGWEWLDEHLGFRTIERKGIQHVALAYFVMGKDDVWQIWVAKIEPMILH